MRIAVLGAGGVGGYFGARLAAHGNEVIFIARGAHAEAMRRGGLRVLSPAGDLHLEPVRLHEDWRSTGLVDIVLVAVKGLVNIGEMKRLWRLSREEFLVSMIAFAAVLLLGILNGVIVAAVASLLLLIRRAAHPRVALLGRIPGSRAFSDRARHPECQPVPGALIVRVDAALLYFNAEPVRETVWQSLRAEPGPPSLLVWDLSTSAHVDMAGARMLARLHQELAEVGVQLRLVAALPPVRALLRAEGLRENIDYFGRQTTVADVVDEFQLSGREP